MPAPGSPGLSEGFKQPGALLGGAVVRATVEREGLQPDAVEDAILGCGFPEG
jgi:acetyl-CoA C-acetyltransferase/acetyl-CoA acyltransferase